ncbi:WhiB family transcriptional regulator [Streptomyces sp. NPDC002386]
MANAQGHWSEYATCRSSDPDELFVDGNPSQRQAKARCTECEVRIECLAEALDHRIEFGIWGGMTERERRALLRRKPNVSSWRKVLDGTRPALAGPLPAG